MDYMFVISLVSKKELVTLGICLLIIASLGGYFLFYLPEQIRQEYEKTEEEIRKRFEDDEFLLDQTLGLSDFDDGRITQVEKQGLLKLLDNLLNDYPLTFRTIVAGKYLADSATGGVIGNSTMVNDAVDVVLKHRLMNNGTDDPSGFASVTDLIKLMYIRWSPGYVDLPDGTKVSRKELSDMHLNATSTFADYSWRVLPKIGDYLYSQSYRGGEEKEWLHFAYAPYSQNASNDPRFSLVPFHPSGPLCVFPSGELVGLPWDENYFYDVLYKHKEDFPNWDEWYQAWNKTGRSYAFPILKQWVKTIDFSPTKAAKDLDALKNGLLNMTDYRYSYLPKERKFDVGQFDQFLIQQGKRIDETPIEKRPFGIYTKSLHRYLQTRGLRESLPLLPEMSGKVGAFRCYKDFGLPDPEKSLLYATGVQYVINPAGSLGTEYWGMMILDDSASDPRGNYTDTYNRFYIIDGKLIANGEPTPIPSYSYPFIDKKTEDCYRELGVYGKNFILLHHMIDEGNPWLKVFDNTDELGP